MTAAVEIELPHGLSVLAGAPRRLLVRVDAPVTQRSLLDALEADYPVLRGTVRDHATQRRRPFLRFFACGEDWSHASPDDALPAEIADGREAFLIVGAIAGG